jgi:transposase-like protein
MEKQRRTYPEELKRNALELLRTSGKSAAAIALDLGIDPGLLNRWRREAAREGDGTKAFTGMGCLETKRWPDSYVRSKTSARRMKY